MPEKLQYNEDVHMMIHEDEDEFDRFAGSFNSEGSKLV